MNTKKVWVLTLVALLSFSLYSCKDDEGGTTPTDTTPKTKFEMLTTGSWVMESGSIDPSVEVDIFGNIVTISTYWQLLGALNGSTDAEPCVKDNEMIFNTDNTITLDEGGSKCDDADPQTEGGGNWTLNETKDTLTFSAFPYDPLKEERNMEIIEMTNAKLILKMDYKYVDNINMKTTDHVITLNFKKK